MDCCIVGIDQTVGRGLQNGMAMLAVDTAAAKLTALEMKIFDVGLAAWQTQMGKFSAVPSDFRAVIPADPEAVITAANWGFKRVRLEYKHSGIKEQGLAPELLRSLAVADICGLEVCLYICNASSLQEENWLCFRAAQEWAGVTILAYGDADGILDPFSTYQIMRQLQLLLPNELEFHANNRHGLATANALAALRAGVVRVAAALAGVSGQAAWEEILLGLRILHNCLSIDTKSLAADCAEIMAAVGEPLSPVKAVIGSAVFAHESGIHVDGVTKNPGLYELFTPESVGLQRQVVLGKHSGKAAIKAKFSEWGIDLSEDQAEILLEEVRQLAVLQQRALSDDQVLRLYKCQL